ncbi:MAG: histidine ammonia-lyase [Phycisphaerae bacterium]|nr:histidine ammonia-lyase [Phycisphaerae bacterium]
MATPRSSTFLLDGRPLDCVAVEQVARQRRPVALAPEAAVALERSRETLEHEIKTGTPVYGVNTGFGSLSRVRIPDEQLSEVQHNLIRSHAAGVGPHLPEDIVRAMLLMLAGSLSRGCSGVRPVVVERLVAILNAGITPCVPETGSVGASGDLAPLAHAAQVLIGEGEALVKGARLPSAAALRQAGIEPLALAAKEGLALINGTHLMAAHAALLMTDFDRLLDAALVAAAMTIDACRGTNASLDERVFEARRQPGAARVASRLRLMLRDSTIIPSHAENDPRVQDPYSLRCAPHVLGAALDAADYVRKAVNHELGAVTDNPLVFSGPQTAGAPAVPAIVSAGNFHGMPIAIPLDILAISIAHIAGISERRTYLMLSAADPESHLKPHLSPRPGLHSGLMITQYVAAACCNEIAALASPASVINLPTCAGMEDYNSFGPRAAAKARRSLELATQVVAIELLCAAQGLESHRPLRSGEVIERAHARIRAVVPTLTADRSPAADIEAIAAMIRAGRFGD